MQRQFLDQALDRGSIARPPCAADQLGAIELRDRTITLGPGELFVVPKGVEHRPVAKEEVHILLIEPSGTPNTGDPTTAAARRVI